MAEITKLSTNILAHIRHDLRELPSGKSYGNIDINPALTKENYSLLGDRCRNAKEANIYRKNLEKEIFKYNRKTLIHAVEICVQCPSDCPTEQKDAFFKETYNYICSTLPMGDRCVFVAQVHKDERKYSPSGKLISKDHLHVIYVPGVPDKKHDGFEYKMCADQLTKKTRLKKFHPGLQKHLDQAGIHATVFRKKKGNVIALSVNQLKELTDLTGMTLDHSLTVEELTQIINTNIEQTKQLKTFQAELEKIKSIQQVTKDHITTQELTTKRKFSWDKPKNTDKDKEQEVIL